MPETHPEPLLRLYTVYAHPRDFPAGYVLRGWTVYRGRNEPVPDLEARTYTDLESARSWCQHAGLTRLPRQEGDDPAILETWL